jgi:neurocan core protein
MRGGKSPVRDASMRHKTKAVAVVLAAGALVVSVPQAGWATSTIPSAPRSVRMTPGNTTVTVRWHLPADTGGRPITQYEVIPYLDNLALGINVFNSTKTSQMIFGLKNGRSYTFKVAAKNSVGWSRLSARSDFVTVGVPLPPGAVSAVPGKGRATVSWHAPPSNNGSAVTSYRVTPLLDGAVQAAHAFNSTQTHQVITGLQGGKPYTFEVAAHNHNGYSAPSNVSATIVIGK